VRGCAAAGSKEYAVPTYLLSVCYPADATQPPPDELAAIMTRVGALSAEMQAAGVWVFGGGLHDASSSTVVEDRDGEVVLTDGPFIESKEQIGGITIVDVADLDAALSWGAKKAAAIGVPIEVRPFQG
jgi:hypothetical protein